MSNTRYIEFDSTYRNRNEWPLPAEFEVLISQTGRKDRSNAVDPISDSANITRWTSNTFDTSGVGVSITGLVDTSTSLIGAVSDGNLVIVNFSGTNNPQTTEDYYLHSVIESVTIPVERRRILSYKLLNNTSAQFILEAPFSNAVVNGTTVTIKDPTDLSDNTNPLVFVPNGLKGLNRYRNCILYNETRSISSVTPDFRIISSYDVNTHMLTLDALTNPVTSWLATDTYSIRKTSPIIGKINNNIISTNVASLPLTFSREQNYYRNSWVRMVSGASSGQVRKIFKYETYSGKLITGTITTVQFSSDSSLINGYYNGSYIQILSGPAINDVRKVISYDGSTRIATVDSNFTAVPGIGDEFAFRSLHISPDFSSNINTNDDFEILYFSKDNLNPFIYNGSQISQQEMVCYEIELLNISLPNKSLATGSGSRIAFYPYVYVEIANVSGTSAGAKNTIYSNNPNSTRMIFRAAVDDSLNPAISSFVKIDGDGMVQTLKFKPNDNLRFSVRLSNGELYQTVEIDNKGPLAPNPELQISCMFAIKRL